jgi:predicted transcriptional regulator
MKSVLISIQPKWCELIASGKKTVEVRKTRPKLETPFKVYIYCTLPPQEELFTHGCIREYAHELIRLQDGRIVYDYGMRLCCDIENRPYSQDNFLCKKVIGEFVCEWIDTIECDIGAHLFYSLNGTCLTQDDFIKYCNGKDLYAWHISDLVIYDKPMELSEFERACPDNVRSCAMCRHSGYSGMKCSKLIKPPQSWAYVESEDAK